MLRLREGSGRDGSHDQEEPCPIRAPRWLPGLTTLRLDGDAVVERHSSADMLSLLVQLGLMPAVSAA